MNAQIALLPEHTNVVPFPTKSNEWYTPARYIEAARRVMGSIDLNPASCELANRTVKATRFYTAKENGLAQEWYGNVWLNPPYTSPTGLNPMKPWSEKLIAEYQAGNVKQAITFIMGGTYNKWFQSLWDYLICFTDHKVHFHRPNQPKECLRDTTVFIYLGPNESAFIDIFSEFGTIARRVSAPRKAVTPLGLWEGV